MSEPKDNVIAADTTDNSASTDPIKLMMAIASTPDSEISAADKKKLIEFAQNRFKHRRRMAYLCLTTIIISIALLFLGAFIDGLSPSCSGKAIEGCSDIMRSIRANEDLFIWGNGFLTSIVAAYYGVSAWRPNS